jgi:hypothetical protein
MRCIKRYIAHEVYRAVLPTRQEIPTQTIATTQEHLLSSVKTCAGDLENRQPVKVPVKFRRNLLLGCSTWSDLFGVGDDDDLTDEGVFHGGVQEKVGDVCARG